MHKRSQIFAIPYYLVRWAVLILPLSLVTGSLVALFLWLLDRATTYRQAHLWLLLLLPVAGVGIYFLYKLLGKNSEKGNNLIMEEIHAPGGGVPGRMAPLVLLSTVITHLFGGSAGREGTAVQMGGSVAGVYGKWCKLSAADLKILLMAGIAAGFGAVFGTPVAGAVFALEVLAIGIVRYSALWPCLMAAIVADLTTKAWGIHHTQYAITTVLSDGYLSWLHIDGWLLVKTVLAGALFGLASYLFSEFSHTLKWLFKYAIKVEWVIPLVGGCVVIVMCYLLGTTDYIGLGVTGSSAKSVSIVSAFHAGGADYGSWFWKLLLTAITLSSGFKGGEVTPLFFIGATLGNTIAVLSGAPVDVFAAMGFIAVFAGATNTPLACTIMGVELFGGTYTLYFAIACFTAYYFSGHTGIYTSQQIGNSKLHGSATNGLTIAQEREQRVAARRERLNVVLDKWFRAKK